MQNPFQYSVPPLFHDWPKKTPVCLGLITALSACHKYLLIPGIIHNLQFISLDFHATPAMGLEFSTPDSWFKSLGLKREVLVEDWVRKVQGWNVRFFQKGSPLVPFFKYAYGKLRQTGTLARIKQKWEKKEISGNCGSNQLRPISFNKIASVIVLLLLGTCIAFLISVIEIFYKRRAEAKVVDKVFIVRNEIQSLDSKNQAPIIYKKYAMK